VLRPRAFRANAEDVSGLYRFVVRQSRRYGAIRAPTAIVSGDADTIVWTNLHSRSLVREIPGARLVILPGVGHMPHHAPPDIVAREIEAVAAKP
jgi:pimeloyl-ACP methyl ester carboxylesterase